MNCKKAVKLLPLYLSDDLEGKELLVEVKNHLSECLSCFREYQGHLKARRALKRLSQRPDLGSILEGFSDGVMRRVGACDEGPAAPVPKVVYRLVPRFLAAAAMILVLIVGGFYLLGSNESNGPAVARDDGPELHNTRWHGDSIDGNPQPMLVSDSLNGENPKEAEQERKSRKKAPELIPLPQRFPTVQPVDFQRNF